MTDSELIADLLKMAVKMECEMRFEEAKFLNRVVARLMVLPKQLTRMEHPSIDDDTRRVINHIWGA